MSDHTPGPYSILEALDNTGDVAIVATVDGKRVVIGETFTLAVKGLNVPSLANGRLFGAAPDLLAVVQTWITLADSALPIFDADLEAVVSRTRAAIAQATGTEVAP